MANSTAQMRPVVPKSRISLDRNSPLPLYYQLQTHIRQEIANGTWKEEEMIPSEQQLAATLGIAPGTVRTAINGLVHDGTLVREQGRGTFVVPLNFRGSYIHFFHLPIDSPEDQMYPSSEIIDHIVVSPGDKIRKILKLTKSDEVIAVKRLRRKNHVPIVLEDIFLPKKYFPNFDKDDLVKEPVYATYTAKYRLPIVAADDYFEPRTADREEAAALVVRPGDPVIFVERIAYTHDDRAFEYRKCIGRGDMFRYHVSLGRKNV
jgi:GntR family transcriptional regulator